MGAGGGLKVESFPSELRFPVSSLLSRCLGVSYVLLSSRLPDTDDNTAPRSLPWLLDMCVYCTVPPQQ
jgi:hypothetical protein